MPSVAAEEPPRVDLGGTVLEGAWVGLESKTAVFKGIPYAAPPVGELRWRPPAPAPTRPGVQAATDFGPACIQDPEHTSDWYRYLAETMGQDPALVPALEPISEDCLHLNIWTANLGGEDLLPVMVWIHGGANNSGSPTEVPYDGTNLTAKGVVMVSFNYRLNVFGFLAHPELTAESDQGSSGNYALLDQIAALEWIQRNIAAFGGDPDRVTLFGESAGATNIAYLMTSPLARGLFHRAISQSGGYAVSEYRTLADLEAIGMELASAVTPDGSDDSVGSLRAVEAEELYRLAGSLPSWSNVPNVDGWVLEDAPGRVFEAGGQAPVPLLIGFNRDEWTTLGHYGPHPSLEGFHRSLRETYGELADRALELYPAATDRDAASRVAEWSTDITFGCPSRFIADRVADQGGEVYFYLFTRSAPGPGGAKLGAYHGAETAYVTNNLALETWVPRDATDQELAEALSDYWVRFAATGDPNGGDRPMWPRYGRERREFLELGDRIEPGSGVRTEFCDLWDAVQRPLLRP